MTDRTAAAGSGLAAIEKEMARQAADALASTRAARATAEQAAAALRATGRLLLLGMGASHAAGRIVEPVYRRLGIEAIAVPLSEQLASPLSVADKVVLLASQSGESAEVVRWLGAAKPEANVFGMTLDPGSSLARTVPSLVGTGGPEVGFAATRSLVITLALHLPILAALGLDPLPAIRALEAESTPDAASAIGAFETVRAVVCSGRELRGVAEALALGICELARLPAFALEGGQFRHGPLEMLGPQIGVVLFRCDEAGAGLVARAAEAALGAGSPVTVFDASGLEPIPGAVTLAWPRTASLAAALAMLPSMQQFMLGLAAVRVADVGTPRRSSKITRTE